MATNSLLTTQIIERMEQFKPIWTELIVEHKGEFQKLLEAMSVPHFRSFTLSDKALNACEELAIRGWTIQMELSFPDMVDLVAMSVAETDAFFVNYYTERDFAALRSVRAELANRPALAQWKNLLDECFDSFEQSHHLITIPALLSIIEGVVASAGSALTRRRARLVDICVANWGEKGNCVTDAMWYSVSLFVERLFQDASFAQGRPPFINRHWILHGRDSATWTVADALRLFNALQTIDSLLE